MNNDFIFQEYDKNLKMFEETEIAFKSDEDREKYNQWKKKMLEDWTIDDSMAPEVLKKKLNIGYDDIANIKREELIEMLNEKFGKDNHNE